MQWGKYAKSVWYFMTLPYQARKQTESMFVDLKRQCAESNEARRRLLERVAELSSQQNPAIPGLTPAQIERLAMLAEECGEVVQAVMKILRHGYQSQPPRGGLPNRLSLELEIGHVRAVMELMNDRGDTCAANVNTWRNRKRQALRRWTHHQGLSAN